MSSGKRKELLTSPLSYDIAVKSLTCVAISRSEILVRPSQRCNSPPLQEGARIRQISENGVKILFECEDDSTLDVTIVDPGNSVIVRDKNRGVEYLG